MDLNINPRKLWGAVGWKRKEGGSDVSKTMVKMCSKVDTTDRRVFKILWKGNKNQ